MKNLLLVLVLATIATISAATASAGTTNLIENGSFDSPIVGTNWAIFANGGVPGWTSNNNEIEIDYTPILGLPCYSGTGGCQSMEVDGTTFDTISQTVTGLTLGENYVLSWGYGDRPGSGPQQLDVSFGGNLVTSDIGSGSGTWSANSVIVTADATSEVLSFAAIDTSAIGGNPPVGNEVGDVSLTAAPEPASLALLSAGLVTLGLTRRRSSNSIGRLIGRPSTRPSPPPTPTTTVCRPVNPGGLAS